MGILGFLFLPLAQELFNLMDIKPLDGAVEKADKPVFYIRQWLSGDFQKKKEKYIEQEFGFRNFLVRLNNQLAFGLYNKAKANNVIIGKENYLYEAAYIDAYYGKNYIGDELILDKVSKLKFISDTLKKLNKNLIVIIAPGKASFFPEYIPDDFKYAQHKTNNAGFIKGFKQEGIDFIDFNSWFIGLKPRAQYPLYPQYGIHWSIYGAAIATDSLIKYVEKLRAEDLPEFNITGIQTPDTLREPDNDIIKGMNLLFGMNTYKMSYPICNANEDSTKKKPRLLAIGDSYWWNVFNLSISNSVFSDGKFWFYNKTVYPDCFNKYTEVKDIDFKEEVSKSDVVLIVATEATMADIGWGFIDNCYSYYKNGYTDSEDYKKVLNNWIEIIKNDPNWMKIIKGRSEKDGIPIDSSIVWDAKWQISTHK